MSSNGNAESRPRILVVDDDEDVRLLIGKNLPDYEVLGVSSLEELRGYERELSTIFAVVSDFALTRNGEEGEEVVNFLLGCNFPDKIIGMSDQKRPDWEGIDAFICKGPLMFSELRSFLDS